MGQFVKENAHLRTDLEKYQRSYDHIFNKEKCLCEECEELRNNAEAVCKEQRNTEVRQ